MNYGRQTAPGVPGSFPLPNPGSPGTSFMANAVHPSAAAANKLGPRANPLNGGRPLMAGKK
jgi:hypothetical protein